MASGGHNRKTAAELEASATARTDRILNSDNPGREHLAQLLDLWLKVANLAGADADAATIVNAGEQVQKHPAIGVLDTASKRIEALVVLLDRFAAADPSVPELPEGAPPAWSGE